MYASENWAGSLRSLMAYIGPGGGLVVGGSLLAIITCIFTVIVVAIAPVATITRRVLRRRKPRGSFSRVVVLGLDGADPKVIRQLIDKGVLPNFEELSQSGHFSDLKTTAPPLSPSVWSSFQTGRDASHHGIFDFITRDPASYAPRLSSYETDEGSRCSQGGLLRRLFTRPAIRLLRKSEPFWLRLGQRGLDSTVLRVPITFPPERCNGRILSGMCVPDVRGSQGTYTLLAEHDGRVSTTAGEYRRLDFRRGEARTWIAGPATGKRDRKPVRVAVCVTKRSNAAIVRLQGQKTTLRPGQSSPWLRVHFRTGLTTVHGIVRFYLISVEPHVVLYATPVHLDPERPAMPVSHPAALSAYIAKSLGPFGTLGLMEDAAAMNDGALDERGFLTLAEQYFQERKKMLLRMLERSPDDLLVCVIDTPDRIQHMFWRYTEPDHPASRSVEAAEFGDTIERHYVELDHLVGECRQKLSDSALLLIVSDHGFTSFRRGVNLNAWLCRNGYLTLKPGVSPGTEWLQGVDWSKTRAYALGLAGVFINLRGREVCGIVTPGAETRELIEELRTGLTSIVDDERDGEHQAHAVQPIRRTICPEQDMTGPYRQDGPDLIVCYERGYRCSWECARGIVMDSIICENTRPWSGDHCVDPDLVPGILLANHPLQCEQPSIMDIAPTVTDALGVKPDSRMQGRSLLRNGETTA